MAICQRLPIRAHSEQKVQWSWVQGTRIVNLGAVYTKQDVVFGIGWEGLGSGEKKTEN